MGLSTLVPRPLLSQGPGLRWWPKKAYSASLALLVPSPLRHHTPGCVRLCWWLELVQCEEPSPQFCCLPVLVSARGLSESAAIPCILSATFSGLLGSGQLWFSGIHPSPHSAFPYCCVFPIRASHPQVQNTHTHTSEGCNGELALCEHVRDAFLDLSGNIFYSTRKNAGQIPPYCKQAGSGFHQATAWPGLAGGWSPQQMTLFTVCWLLLLLS